MSVFITEYSIYFLSLGMLFCLLGTVCRVFLTGDFVKVLNHKHQTEVRPW